MGLDNYFILHFEKNPECELIISYFRKYFELNDYVLLNGRPLEEGDRYKVLVDQKLLTQLRTEIEPIVTELLKYSRNELAYFEDNGYPEELQKKFYNSEFAPTESRSYAAGHKIIKLYNDISLMINMFEINEDEFFTSCHSSF